MLDCPCHRNNLKLYIACAALWRLRYQVKNQRAVWQHGCAANRGLYHVTALDIGTPHIVVSFAIWPLDLPANDLPLVADILQSQHRL